MTHYNPHNITKTLRGVEVALFIVEQTPSGAIHLAWDGNRTALCRADVNPDDSYFDEEYTAERWAKVFSKEKRCKQCAHALVEWRVQQLPVADRKKLRATSAWIDSQDGALGMWLDGFRPIEADLLKPDMIVAYRDTDIFQLNCVGPVKAARVFKVEHVDWSIIVEHSAGETEVDEGEEVWAK